MTPPALLQRLERELVGQGAPIAELLRPGLTDADIDKLTLPLGISVPEQLRAWWRWHDGAEGGAARETLGGGCRFSTLAQAVSQTLFQRELGTTWAGDDADPEEWFPNSALAAVDTTGGAVIACDCSGAHNDPVPTLNRPRDEPYTRSVQGPSFETVVSWWVDALDSHGWLWDADSDRWTRNPEALPPERLATGLV